MKLKVNTFHPFFVIGTIALLFLLASCTSASPPTPTPIPATETPAPTATPAATATPIAGLDDVTEQSLTLDFGNGEQPYDYLLYLPEDYTPEESWPLVLYLHGAGSRGNDIGMVNGESFLNELGTLNHVPAIVVAPQAASGSIWDDQISTLEAFLTAVEETYPVDSNRIYLTGFSMGGFGSWAWGLENPNRFAAIVPTAGGFFAANPVPENICDLKDTAVWGFASTADTTVPGSLTEDIVLALEACGAENVQMTIYDDATHIAAGARPYYSTSDLYEWLWAQSLEN